MLLFNLSHCAVPFDILWIMTPHWASHNMWLFFFLGTTTSMVRTYVFFSTINGSFIHFFLCSRIFPVGGGGAHTFQREEKKERPPWPTPRTKCTPQRPTEGFKAKAGTSLLTPLLFSQQNSQTHVVHLLCSITSLMGSIKPCTCSMHVCISAPASHKHHRHLSYPVIAGHEHEPRRRTTGYVVVGLDQAASRWQTC